MTEETENESTKSVFIQTVDFDTLKNITQKVNYVYHLVEYQLPNKAESYVDKDTKLTEFVQLLIDYNNPESNESWRLDKKGPVQYSFGEEGEIIIGGLKKLYDVAKCIVIPDLKSIFIVPGKNSIEKGGFKASEALTLTSLISTMPLEMVFSTIPDPEDKNKSALSVTYKAFNITNA